jgi:hypothetical protein
LSVHEESQWTPDAELLEEMDLSDYVEESEEHSSDDINYYSGSNSDGKEEGDNIDDMSYFCWCI